MRARRVSGLSGVIEHRRFVEAEVHDHAHSRYQSVSKLGRAPASTLRVRCRGRREGPRSSRGRGSAFRGVVAPGIGVEGAPPPAHRFFPSRSSASRRRRATARCGIVLLFSRPGIVEEGRIGAVQQMVLHGGIRAMLASGLPVGAVMGPSSSRKVFRVNGVKRPYTAAGPSRPPAPRRTRWIQRVRASSARWAMRGRSTSRSSRRCPSAGARCAASSGGNGRSARARPSACGASARASPPAPISSVIRSARAGPCQDALSRAAWPRGTVR